MSSYTRDEPAPRWTLASLAGADGPVAALGIGNRFHPVGAAHASLEGRDCRSLLDEWDSVLPLLHAGAQRLAAGTAGAAGPSGAAEATGGAGGASSAIAAEGATLLSPVLYPDKLLAVGANYSGHLEEMGLKAEKWESMPFFLRPPRTTLVGPGPTVRIPRSTRQFDWECELAVIVGRRLRHASREAARSGIAGYAIGLDLSCRDLIRVDNELQVDLVRGKSQDTMAPCGPWMVPAAFVPDVHALRVSLAVNGEPMMDASTSEMLYRVDEQLAIISEFLTLEPGDVLFTGSPSGSAGVHGDRWLRDGDRIRAEIEGIGVLEVSVHDDV